MSVKPEIQSDDSSSRCLARSVVEALNVEPSLEAVTINRAEQKISLATLGRTDEPRLTENISGRIQKAYDVRRSEHCLLPQGEADGGTCDAPFAGDERSRITIRHDGDI